MSAPSIEVALIVKPARRKADVARLVPAAPVAVAVEVAHVGPMLSTRYGRVSKDLELKQTNRSNEAIKVQFK